MLVYSPPSPLPPSLSVLLPDSFCLTPLVPVQIAKVLQNLFSLNTFKESDRWMTPLNPWIEKRIPIIRNFFDEIVDVPDPEEYLQVDKYMELTQKAKPVIIISLAEIASTHKRIKDHLDVLAPDADDPLRIVIKDLGDDVPEVKKDDDREMQLTLTNRFETTIEGTHFEEEREIEEGK